MTNFAYFIVVYLFWLFHVHIFATAAHICDEERTMKDICISVRHEYKAMTSYADLREVEGYSICKDSVKFVPENGDPDDFNDGDDYDRAALCYVTPTQFHCIIDRDKDTFDNLLYNHIEDYCILSSGLEVGVINKYVDTGQKIRSGVLAAPIPRRKRIFTVCNDIATTEKICVAIRDDYFSTPYHKALEAKEKAYCEKRIKLISGTGYMLEYYEAAICYIHDSLTICAIDGDAKRDELVTAPYELFEGTPACILNTQDTEVKSKQRYLESGSLLLVPPEDKGKKRTSSSASKKLGFICYLLSFFTSRCFSS